MTQAIDVLGETSELDVKCDNVTLCLCIYVTKTLSFLCTTKSDVLWGVHSIDKSLMQQQWPFIVDGNLVSVSGGSQNNRPVIA